MAALGSDRVYGRAPYLEPDPDGSLSSPLSYSGRGPLCAADKKKWIPARKGKKKYLFKITSLAKEFKKRYLKKLKLVYEDGLLTFPGNTAPYSLKENFDELITKAAGKKWVAYTKLPFAGPKQVLEYLGRYTHRVAITNNRIKKMENGQVTFAYRKR